MFPRLDYGFGIFENNNVILAGRNYGSVNQDDYDTWVGEAALVQWGSGKYSNQGWIRYNRHAGRANYIYTDGHVENLRWPKARLDQYPDHQVRKPLANPPQ